MRKKSNLWIWIGLVAVGVGFLGWNNFSGFFTSSTDTTGVPCINPLLPIPEQYHIHPHLQIVLDGKETPVPANIGLGIAGCERALHTHDATGQIHIEPNYYQEFRLGQFFELWGQPLSKEQVLDKKADADHVVQMTVDGQPSGAYGDLVLKDKQHIVIEYKKK